MKKILYTSLALNILLSFGIILLFCRLEYSSKVRVVEEEKYFKNGILSEKRKKEYYRFESKSPNNLFEHIIRYYPNGKMRYEAKLLNGRYYAHFKSYSVDDKLLTEFRHNGNLIIPNHKGEIGKPGTVLYPYYNCWHLDGHFLTKDEYDRRIAIQNDYREKSSAQLDRHIEKLQKDKKSNKENPE